MRRREFLATTAMAQRAKRPNVLLIMTDDQGWGDFSCHGNPHLKTPNLDGLAKDGVEFTRFTVSPVCAPTRASLLTGRYNLRCGVHGVTHGRETMKTSEVTIAKALKSAGYRTGLFGKWHLGENYPHVPHAMGFDRFTGFRPGHWQRYFDTPVERNGKPARLSGFITDALADEAMGFMNAGGAPWFTYVAFNAPHSPYQCPDKYYDRFRKLGLTEELAAIYGMVENIDDNVGRLVKAAGDDVIVLFLTDNGPQTDRYNSVLRARKGSIFEGGTRAPLFVRWRGTIPAAKKIDTIAAHIDIFPTLIDLCGVKAPAGPPVDGTSLAPILRTGAAPTSWPDRIIFSHSDGADPLRRFPGSARTQAFKMVNGTELYDMKADPGEKTNVAAEHPQELARLNDAYNKWLESVTTGFTPGGPPIPVGHAEENPAVLNAPRSVPSGGAAFRGKQGYANDYLIDWKPGAKTTWTIQVTRAGRYAIGIQYTGGGWPLTLSAGAATFKTDLPPAPHVELPLPERVHSPVHAPDVEWKIFDAGEMTLPAGITNLVLQSETLNLKSVRLRYIS